jgi:hypothetical protein
MGPDWGFPKRPRQWRGPINRLLHEATLIGFPLKSRTDESLAGIWWRPYSLSSETAPAATAA